MKYKCLVVDHDDTIVNSTATIHFPSFELYMKEKRPEIQMTLDEYFALNFDPGVVALFRDICGLSEEEFKEEMQGMSRNLSHLQDESNKLIGNIMDYLKELGI